MDIFQPKFMKKDFPGQREHHVLNPHGLGLVCIAVIGVIAPRTWEDI